MSILIWARRAFANTPANDWKVTGVVKQRLFRFAYGDAGSVVEFRGMQFKVPGNDASAVPGLVGGYYESISFQFFESLAANAKVVFDVGGCFGIYAVGAAKAMHDDGLVVCFEPEPTNFEFAAENIVLNGVATVGLVPEAVGKESGDGTIYVRPRNFGGASLSPAREVGGEARPVAVTTLDDFCSLRGIASVDLIKIDVEGHEGDVLCGATGVLQTRPSILIEFAAEVTRQAGYRLEDVSQRLAEYYDHFLVIDDVRHRTRWAKADELVHLAERRASLNVLAIQREEDLAVVGNQANR